MEQILEIGVLLLGIPIACLISFWLGGMSLGRKLKASEARYRETVENASEGIIQASAEGRFLFVNSAFASMLGYSSPAEMLSTVTDVSHQIYVRPELRAEFIDQLNRDGSIRCEFEAWKKDRTTVWLHVSARVVKDPQNNFLYYESIVENISDRRKKEEELKRVAESLEKSNLELERFAHIVAHDLTEPLRTIVSYSNLLCRLQPKRDAETDECVEFIVGAAKRALNLVKDILAFSEAHLHSPQEEIIDTCQVVDEVCRDLSTLISDTGANIKVHSLPLVHGHRSKVFQLFQNLLNNSLKFRRLSVPLRVEVAAEPQESEWLFSIKDNGIGFNEANAAQAFEPFTRLVDQTQYPGSGTGLAICKGIVESYGGRIWMQSTPGKGTTVFFTIPESKKKMTCVWSTGKSARPRPFALEKMQQRTGWRALP